MRIKSAGGWNKQRLCRRDKQVKEIVKGREKILAGNFFITGKWIDKKAVSIPASQYWKSTIKKVTA